MDASLLKVWFVDNAGTIDEFDCVYDAVSKTATFVTTHFSYYKVMCTGADTTVPSSEPDHE